VVGVGLSGPASLAVEAQQQVAAATVLAGSDRLLRAFPDSTARRVVLGDLAAGLEEVRSLRAAGERAVVLVSGDPLFFGLGRLLCERFAAEELAFYPTVSSIQLAFARLQVPWQDAVCLSAHGRSPEALTRALQSRAAKIAVLTDTVTSPRAIHELLGELGLANYYDLWVCENLGGADERVGRFEPARAEAIASLNVVVLLRREAGVDRAALPLLGVPDEVFASFPDRPGLITKREVRIAILGELALQQGHVAWDIGAGTGSVAIEIARLTGGPVWAIEQTAIGQTLIEQNCARLGVETVQVVRGAAPEALCDLPTPDRVFIGGSSGTLNDTLDTCAARLKAAGAIVLAFATLERQQTALTWGRERGWKLRLLQVQLARSVAIAQLTRWSPLNPVTLVQMRPP